MEKIILASASPRRSEILEAAGIPFEVVCSKADESQVEKNCEARLYVQELALLKATAAAKSTACKNKIVVAADTVVVSEGEILGKPADDANAREMLAGLSGRVHEVMTGICVFRQRDAFTVCDTVTTKVCFKKLSPEAIAAYVRTGEPADKAGAYGIQGRGALLCEKIDGDYFNVVGLPVSRLCDILSEEFGITVF